MARGWIIVLSAVLAGFGMPDICHAHNPVTGACAAFSPDGTLATGTLKNGDLETKVDEHGTSLATHIAIPEVPVWGLSQRCEESFSDDGKWIATVAPNKQLTLVILDRKIKTVHRSFSSDWYRLHDAPIELMYKSSFLAGFLQDDSVALWRYVPRAVSNTTDASNADLHIQRWSVEGELLSDQDLGAVGFGPGGGRQPVALSGLKQVWLPTYCGGSFCYRGVEISEAQITGAGTLILPSGNAAALVALPGNEGFLSVVGKGTAQTAALLDLSGHVTAEVPLPHFPNLLGPLVPDWFAAHTPAISHDGQVAAVGRTRIAWVLVDTDRDWGSEIVLLRMHPLAVLTKVKTGKGGVTAIAVDHHNGIVRLVGFWKGSWHDLQCDEQHPDKCRQ